MRLGRKRTRPTLIVIRESPGKVGLDRDTFRDLKEEEKGREEVSGGNDEASCSFPSLCSRLASSAEAMQ